MDWWLPLKLLVGAMLWSILYVGDHIFDNHDRHIPTKLDVHVRSADVAHRAMSSILPPAFSFTIHVACVEKGDSSEYINQSIKMAQEISEGMKTYFYSSVLRQSPYGQVVFLAGICILEKSITINPGAPISIEGVSIDASMLAAEAAVFDIQ